LARKPIKLSIAKNCQQWGTGAINIDATRIAIEGADTRSGGSNGHSRLTFGEGITSNEDSHIGYEVNNIGRFPSNVLGEIAEPYQKYFYCPKVSRRERHVGFDTTNIPTDSSGYQGTSNGGNYLEKKQNTSGTVGNNHPTVKPIELMKYLIKLITPPGGTVLDPFNGSGSTGCAAVALGHEYIGCELDPAYVEISKRRIEKYNKSENNFDALFE
jgi:site-specific DNA-methyltransferase (adenine-specific)